MKNRQEIAEKVIAIVKETLRCKVEVTEATSFVKDLDVDSLDLVELIMEVEQAFGVEVEDDMLKSIHTVGDVVDYLAK
ncbi:MAG: acyl carrier protein [Clostridia bacterium]|nr:acyl carrier protein [Clostridia bacterium]